MKNIIKNFSLFLLATLCMYSINYASQAPMQPTGAKLPSGPLPKLTDEDMNAMMQMLEGMDEETLDALAKIGEEFIKEAEAQGKDPFELLGFPTEQDQGKQPEIKPVDSVPQQAPEITPPSKELSKVDTQSMHEMQLVLTSLSNHIASIRQKAEADREIADSLKSLKYILDDLTYFVHILKQEKLLKYLVDKEFKQLYTSLKNLDDELSYLEPLFIVQAPSLEQTSPYTMLGVSRQATWAEINDVYQKLLVEKKPETLKKQLLKQGVSDEELKNALQSAQQEYDSITEAYSTILTNLQTRQALERIIDALVKAVYTNNIIEQSKQLLKRYEPEALATKEDQEKKEAKARKEQEEALKKLPPFSMPVFGEPWMGPRRWTPESREDHYGTTAPTSPYYQPSDASKYQPSSGLPSSYQPKDAKPTDKKEKDEKTKKDEKEKKPEDKKKKEASRKVEKKLEELEKTLDELTGYIDQGPIAGGEPAKNLFADLKNYIAQTVDISKLPQKGPAEDLQKNLQKAVAIKKALTDMTTAVHRAKRLLDAPGLSKEERAELKKEAQKLFKEKRFQDSLTELNIRGLAEITFMPTRKVTPKSVPIYSHTILGTPVDLTKPEMQPIRERVENLQLSNPAHLDYLHAFTDAFSKFKEELEKTDKK